MQLSSWVCTAGVLLAVIYLSAASDDDGKKKKLQIGVKKRVDAELCKIKSRKGDSLSMHYTVSHHMLLLYPHI